MEGFSKMMAMRDVVGRIDLCDFHFVNFELGIWVWLLCVEKLLYRHGS